MRLLRILSSVGAGLLALSGAAAAQHTHGYFFAGASTIPGRQLYTYWHGNYLHLGGGGQAGLAQRFTLGGEGGALISTAEFYGRNAAILSFGPGFHFFRGSERKFDPFVSRGVSLLAGRGVGGMWYYAGGINYWFRSHLGLRMEYRDHVWSPEGTNLHFVGARVGLCFR